MALSTPPPPSISPRQMTLLRIVASMAWADGHLAAEEIDLMLNRFSSLFSVETEQQKQIQAELRDYLMQNIPLEELTPKLQSTEERGLVLRLGYEVIRSSSRTADEPKINAEEATAYQALVQLLNLPAETVHQIEQEVDHESNDSADLVDTLTRRLEKFIQG